MREFRALFKEKTEVCEALDAEDIVDHLGVTDQKEVEEWRHPKEELVKEEELVKKEELVKEEEERMTMTVEERLAEDIKVKVGKNITNPP